MLEELLASGRVTGEAKSELLLRLASLYEEESGALRLAADERWIADIDACSATSGCQPGLLKPDHTAADRVGRKAERVLRVLSSQPTWARADEATAHLAAVQELLGEDRAALDTHAALVRTWPESPFAGVSWLSLAEARFEQNEALPAKQAYLRAVRLLDAAGETDLADFARYKLAWAQYNLGELAAGQRTLEQTLDRVLARGGPEATMVDELIRDTARFSAEGGDLERAEAVLRRHGQADMVPELWEKMAAMQIEKGDTDAAVATWRRLLAANPTARRPTTPTPSPTPRGPRAACCARPPASSTNCAARSAGRRVTPTARPLTPSTQHGAVARCTSPTPPRPRLTSSSPTPSFAGSSGGSTPPGRTTPGWRPKRRRTSRRGSAPRPRCTPPRRWCSATAMAARRRPRPSAGSWRPPTLSRRASRRPAGHQGHLPVRLHPLRQQRLL